MTLKVDGSLITIQNASGVNKFSSNDKLLYRKQTYSGSMSLNSNSMIVNVALPGATITNKTAYRIVGTITGTNGSNASFLNNSFIDLSTPVFVSYGIITSGGNAHITDQTVLSSHIKRNLSASDLYLSVTLVNHASNEQYRRYTAESSFLTQRPVKYQYRAPSVYVNLNYTVDFFGWQ